MEVPNCIKWTALEFTYKDSENTWTIVNLLWKLLLLCKYLTGQSCLYAFDTMIYVLNGKKKSGIDYPSAYLLWGVIFSLQPLPWLGGSTKSCGYSNWMPFYCFYRKWRCPSVKNKCIGVDLQRSRTHLDKNQSYSEKLMALCNYLTGQSWLYALDTTIFVLNGKKKSGIDYPSAYLLWGGSFFLCNPSPG